jgi:signal peptidase II
MGRSTALLIAAAVFGLDRVTKVAVEQRMEVYSTIPVIPGFFNLVYTKNPGAAFGMFADSTSPLRPLLLIGVSLVVLGFVAYALLRPGKSGFRASWQVIVGLSLVLGGALGNIYDRALYGEVTDFLEFYQGDWRFAAFNIADTAITTGAGLLILDMWLSRHQTSSPTSSDAAQTH